MNIPLANGGAGLCATVSTRTPHTGLGRPEERGHINKVDRVEAEPGEVLIHNEDLVGVLDKEVHRFRSDDRLHFGVDLAATRSIERCSALGKQVIQVEVLPPAPEIEPLTPGPIVQHHRPRVEPSGVSDHCQIVVGLGEDAGEPDPPLNKFDPNWGRVLAAAGRSGVEVEESRMDLYLGDLCLVRRGIALPFDNDDAIAMMKQDEVRFRLCLNLGEGRATAWGCDLTEEYIAINGDYTT